MSLNVSTIYIQALKHVLVDESKLYMKSYFVEQETTWYTLLIIYINLKTCNFMI